MTIVLTLDPTIEKIVEVLDEMTEAQKKYVLSYALAIALDKRKQANTKKTSMAEIDKIKHAVRKQYAK
jgi:hypothetical protein